MTANRFGVRQAPLRGVPARTILVPLAHPVRLALLAAIQVLTVAALTAALILALPPARTVVEGSVVVTLVVVALRAIGDSNEQVHYYPHYLCGNAVRS